MARAGPREATPQAAFNLPARRRADGLSLSVHLTPRAAETRLAGVERAADGTLWLKARVKAAPEAGAANRALIRLLAQSLGIAQRQVTIARGATERRKLIHLIGEAAELERRLASSLGEVV